MSFTGGKLKLKGGAPLVGGVNKKKQKKKSDALAIVDAEERELQQVCQYHLVGILLLVIKLRLTKQASPTLASHGDWNSMQIVVKYNGNACRATLTS